MNRRGRDEAGSTLIEFALIALLLFTLIFGIFEFGMVFRARTTNSDATADGARIGAIQGPDLGPGNETADYSIMKAIREETSAIDPENIVRIVVFKGSPSGAGSPTAQVPAQCKLGNPQAGRCNVYNPNDAFERVQAGDASYFNCTSNPSGPACSWDPVSRRDGPNPNQIDYLGVWIKVEHPFVTGLFGETITIESASVVRLEPGIVE